MATIANINWQWLLFSLDGRLNRAPYWLVPIGLMLAVVALAVLLYGLLGTTAAIFAGVTCVAAVVLMSITMGVKRLHDRNKSGHWLWIFYGVPALLDGSGNLFEPSAPGVSLAMTIAGLGISIWGIIELGFLPGDDGSNDYGPNPLSAGR